MTEESQKTVSFKDLDDPSMKPPVNESGDSLLDDEKLLTDIVLEKGIENENHLREKSLDAPPEINLSSSSITSRNITGQQKQNDPFDPSESFFESASIMDIHRKVVFVEEKSDHKDDISGLFDDFYVDEELDEDEEQLPDKDVYEDEEEKARYKSIVSYTLKYDFDTRYDDTLDEHKFKEALDSKLTDILTLGCTLGKEVEEGVEEQQEEEEVSVISEESEFSTPRSVHLERFHLITQQLKQTRIINFFLQRKLSLYFRKKKIPYVFVKDDLPDLAMPRYERLLDNLEYIFGMSTTHKENLANELNRLREFKKETNSHVEKLFGALQQREKEIGHGLINSKTGNEMPDGYADHKIARQKKAMEQKCKMRQEWLCLQTMVNDRENEIKALDKIDDDHSLQQFLKEKAENRMRFDKIEELDRELNKYRVKSRETVQILAHLREKIYAFGSDIQDATYHDSFLERNKEIARACLNELKQERDKYRQLTAKLEEDSGLLVHKNLMEDMKQSTAELEQLKRQLDDLQRGHKLSAKKTQLLRKKLEQREDLFNTTSESPKKSYCFRKSSLTTISRPRKPTIFQPTLPKGALDNVLKDFKLNITKIEYR